MAEQDDTFDPNDLESIDALLDEAELEAVSEESDDDPVLESPELDTVDDLPDMEELADESTDLPDESNESDDILDSLEGLDLEDEPEVVDVSEPKEAEVVEEPEPVVETDNIVPNVAEKKVAAVDNTDEFLEKRASAQVAQNSNMAAEDMDSIKKLIIIFGSVLSVLALSGIGIGLWGALAASSAGMDEETLTLIESIKVSSEGNNERIHDVDKTAQSVEKKLDAINFQIEQLVADMAKTSSGTDGHNNEIIDPLGLGGHQDSHATEKTGNDSHNAQNTHAVKTTHDSHAMNTNSHTQTAPPSLPAVAAENPELMKKVTSVNYKLIKAQRRIDEVNGRVKKIQDQYKALMQSIKTVEKQVLVEQAEKAKKQAAMKEAKEKNRYQYSAPDAAFYDQSVTDSYP
ncbi:hypothetical protein [Thiomicrorhabdus sp. Milos-T2]|uniref:hypothetical protein n=1 Tax=Thiomicrorhabdus sp. Milos-T2 TaxID=90814 RepID=UPI000494BEB9|nr:hypothetical protein [Thiomicrorhabdus sp. Milos-T2]